MIVAHRWHVLHHNHLKINKILDTCLQVADNAFAVFLDCGGNQRYRDHGVPSSPPQLRSHSGNQTHSQGIYHVLRANHRLPSPTRKRQPCSYIGSSASPPVGCELGGAWRPWACFSLGHGHLFCSDPINQRCPCCALNTEIPMS